MNYWQCATKIVGGTLLLVLTGLNTSGRSLEEAGKASGAETVVRGIYDLVSFEAGSRPDWDSVRAQFLPGAVVTLRTARDQISVFSLEGFVNDFISFIDRTKADEVGFREHVLEVTGASYGDIAEYKVLYEAEIIGRGRPPTRGLDLFLLVRTTDGWKIAAITNELVRPDLPLPAGFRSGN